MEDLNTFKPEDLNKNSILLLVSFSRIGNRRKVPNGMVQVDADQSAISVSKELLDTKELVNIVSLDGQIRQWVCSLAVPSGILKDGIYRLPISLVDEVDKGLTEYQAKREKLIEELIAVYPVKVEEARARLRTLYNAADYPPEFKLRESFNMKWRYLAMDIPKNISSVLVQKEREKAAADIAAEVDEIRLTLRSAFNDLITHAVSSLSVADDGKPKIFRDSMVTNMEEFFKYFNARNITGDEELAGLVQKSRDIMQGVDPDALRKDLPLRQSVQKAMNEVIDTINKGVMLKPSRRFTMATETAPQTTPAEPQMQPV